MKAAIISLGIICLLLLSGCVPAKDSPVEIIETVQQINVSYDNCPVCNCNIDVPDNKLLLDTINNNIIQLQNKEVFETPSVVYYIEEYVGNCSDERQVAKSKESLERIEKSLTETNTDLENIQEVVDNIEDDTHDIKQDISNLFKR